MCNCIQETEDLLKAHFVKKVGYDNVMDYGFVNEGILFSNKPAMRMYFPFELTYLPIKKDKTLGMKKTYKSSMLLSYCPFCGEKIKN